VQPGARWLQEERRTLALRTENWADALRLSGPKLRAPLAVAAAETERDPATALRYAKQAWTANPSLAPAAVAYANRLRAAGKGSRGNEVLRRATQPHPDVATAYLADLSDKQDRLRAANGLAQQNANHPESHLLQAKAALDAGMTTEALRHIKAVRAAGLNQRRVWVLLADIADQEGHGNEAQDALRHVATADPDPFWRCAACGTAHGRWQPVCDACNTPGEINWVQPSQDAVVRQVPLLDHADSSGGSLAPI